MEEILASIKRVIADDSRPAAPPPRVPRATPRPEADPLPSPEVAAEDDVLELNDPLVEDGRLMSQNAAVASRNALAALAAMRQQEEAGMPRGADGPLEQVVREMLKPMLKLWLDQHLPEIVEQLVTREIVRITGKSL